MNEIDRLKTKLQKEKDKNKILKQEIRLMKRKLLEETKKLEEKIKDIMYMGDLDGK